MARAGTLCVLAIIFWSLGCFIRGKYIDLRFTRVQIEYMASSYCILLIECDRIVCGGGCDGPK